MPPRKTTARARNLRNNPTDAEKKLWHRLRGDQLGTRFRRQFPIGPYIADFACPDAALVIELDGGQHAENQENDAKRAAFMQINGYKTLRFWNNDILNNIEAAMEQIKRVMPATETAPGTPGAAVKSGTDRIRIRGGKKLNGTITISGAKNAALPLMCAAILSPEPLQLTNMPVTLGDIKTLGEALEHMGVRVALRPDGVAVLHAAEITSHTAPYELVSKMRASVLVLGPLLARVGAAEVSLPGGCAIGTRPVDLHIDALREMGAEIEIEGGYIKARAPHGLKGATIEFDKVSVGATENLMMAAVLADGVTVLGNAALEPEIVDLGQCLIAMGAQIEGLGTPEITITGVKKLRPAVHDVVPDRIETGTWMIGVTMTGGKLHLKNARLDHLEALVEPLEKAGATIEHDAQSITISRNGKPLTGTDIMTAPYPGFPTDLQAQFMTMLTQCKGAGMVTETIFENRFMHVPELGRMGADITVHHGSALVRGVKALKGAEVMATDLRASASLVLAGLIAEGDTVVNRIYHLDRGYENLVEKLKACGADIERFK